MTRRLPATAGIRAALLLIAAVLAAACGGGESEPAASGGGSGVRAAGTPSSAAASATQQLDGWAREMCALQREFDRRAADLADGVDPATLDLAARQARYQRIGLRQIELYRDVEAALSALDPPSGATFFHRALLLQVRGLAEALERQSEAVAAATTTAQIDATNQEVELIRRQASAEVRFAEQAMPGPVRTAVAACGGAGGLGAP